MEDAPAASYVPTWCGWLRRKTTANTVNAAREVSCTTLMMMEVIVEPEMPRNAMYPVTRANTMAIPASGPHPSVCPVMALTM